MKVDNSGSSREECMATDSPVFSVIMPSYNHDKFIAEAIESVLGQTFGNLELIIIDDASTDNSPRVIEEYARDDFRIRAVFHTENKGIARTVNDGLDAARGRYVALLASDDVFGEDRLGKFIAVLNDDENLVVWSDLELIDQTGSPLGITWSQYYGIRDMAELRSGDLFGALIERSFVGVTCFKRNEFRYEERLGYYNDYLFALDLAAHYRYFFIDECLGKYRIHGENISLGGSRDIWIADKSVFYDIVLERYGYRLTRRHMARINAGIARYNILTGRIGHSCAYYLKALKFQPTIAIALLRFWLMERRGLKRNRELLGDTHNSPS